MFRFLKGYGTAAALSIFGAIAVFVTYNWFTEFSGFAVIMLKAGIAFAILMFYDKIALGDIDTHDELKKGNIAYAILLFGLCFILGCALIASAL